jgi:hypothetical protein
MQQALQQL